MSTERGIAGVATDDQKERVVLWLKAFSKNFAGDIVKRVKPVRYDVTLGRQDMQNSESSGSNKSGILVCELVIEDGKRLPISPLQWT